VVSYATSVNEMLHAVTQLPNLAGDSCITGVYKWWPEVTKCYVPGSSIGANTVVLVLGPTSLWFGLGTFFGRDSVHV